MLIAGKLLKTVSLLQKTVNHIICRDEQKWGKKVSNLFTDYVSNLLSNYYLDES